MKGIARSAFGSFWERDEAGGHHIGRPSSDAHIPSTWAVVSPVAADGKDEEPPIVPKRAGQFQGWCITIVLRRDERDRPQRVLFALCAPRSVDVGLTVFVP